MSSAQEDEFPWESLQQPRQARPDPGHRVGGVRTIVLRAVLIGVPIGFVLGGLALNNYFRYGEFGQKEATAHLQTQKLADACSAYKDKHGEYPPSLEVLTVPESGKVAPLEDKDLLDPWGGKFHYDLSNRDRQTGRPKIFTVSPEGQEISNW
jgi:hypothetical protein